MAYTSGGLISASDYNTLVGSNSTTAGTINYVWDVGNGAIGYGQGAVATATSGTTVAATQWSTMLNALNRCLGHQSGAGAQLGPLNFTAGQTITAFANVITAKTTINTNYASYTAQGTTTTGITFTTGVSSTTGLPGYVTIDRFVAFASADAARYFFNAGGSLRLVVGYNSGNGSGSTLSLQRLIDQNNGIIIYNTSNSGRQGTGGTVNTNTTTIGYRNTNYAAETLITRVYDATGNYTADYSEVNTYTNSNDTTNGANGNQVNFRYRYVVSDHPWDDTISLNITTRVDIIYPETTYLNTSSWGTPTIG
jgi:hypothetical protein